jgi:hypothetical protein
LSIHRFPAFCATLVGGSTFLQLPINRLLVAFARFFTSALDTRYSPLDRLLVKFLAALLSASVAFKLINGAPSSSFSVSSASLQLRGHVGTTRLGPFDEPPETGSTSVDDATLGALSLAHEDLSGRTLDLTLFAVVRALDVVISSAWDRMSTKATTRFRRISQATPPLLFYFSAATIMHAWFYSPSRLPQAYNAWIAAAAGLDHRLLLALRHARYGTWVYGKDTGMAPLLGSLCHDYGLPEKLGDPAVTIPLPCEVVHMGCSKSCEQHALVRFWRGWLFAAKMYGPLQLIVVLRHAWKKATPGGRLAGLTQPVLLQAVEDVARSSAFLGAFVALVYYGVCLSRTRLGPKLFSYSTVTPQMWDSGLCVMGGCLLCGTSILIEQSRKRLEILFFLLPRAAATWFPRRYLPENRWKEHVAFTLSAAVLITTAQQNPKRVRGVFGKVLHGVLKTN